MTEHHPESASVKATDADCPATVEVSVPDVRLVVTVDLTGHYATQDDVSRALYEQTIRASDCHTVVVRVGEDAMRLHVELPRAIAGAFFLSARRIEIHVPAGTRHSYFVQRVRNHLKWISADHERTVNRLRTPG
ncbi:hypothetical protein ACFXAZ_12075 [Streptomyces sp. NPDC059477]|uniref:hypothetical protein n=1 Tax=Streptomyces sp. NPDC059477 TaxID=3346847 RepID=UPI0036BD435C